MKWMWWLCAVFVSLFGVACQRASTPSIYQPSSQALTTSSTRPTPLELIESPAIVEDVETSMYDEITLIRGDREIPSWKSVKLEQRAQHKRAKDVPGLCWRDNAVFVQYFENRSYFIKTIEDLPERAFDLVRGARLEDARGVAYQTSDQGDRSRACRGDRPDLHGEPGVW